MTGSAPAWAVWVALGLWGLAGVVGAVAFVLARKYVRQLKPMLMPLLAMLAPPTLVDPRSDEELLQAMGAYDDDEPAA